MMIPLHPITSAQSNLPISSGSHVSSIDDPNGSGSNNGEKSGVKPKILILTGNRHLRQQLMDALGCNGSQLQVLTNPDELWEMPFPEAPTCLICSHPLKKNRTGIEILEGIQKREKLLPTIIIGANLDLHLGVRLMKAGACDLLEFPVDSAALCRAIDQAHEEARRHWPQAHAIHMAKARVAELDKREREVVRLVLHGRLNKEIADQLDLALITIKVYRARAMKKLGAGNAAEMVRLAALGGLCEETPTWRCG